MTPADQHPRAWYMANAVLNEWPRVVAWHARHDPETGLRRSWLEAMWSTADNPPSFDQRWDEDMEPYPHCEHGVYSGEHCGYCADEWGD